MSDDCLITAVVDGVLSLTLNRPDKRNALDSALVDRLHEELERANLDNDVRAVALRGAGKDFCAGADLAELLESLDQSSAEHEAHAHRLGAVFIKMRRLPKPVVAIVHGRALAGGCGLASACDLVLAHADAMFGYPEIKRGFVPAMVLAMLTRAVGEKVAFDLVATGKLVTATDAHALGLVSRVLPGDAFETDVDIVLHGLTQSSASAMGLIKQQLYELEGRNFEDAIALGAKVNAVARSTPDFRKAVEQFLNRIIS